MNRSYVLIAGRTSKQGSGISEGKFGESYQAEIQTLLVSPQDMQELELADGERVRMSSPEGQVEVTVSRAKPDELPPGLLFIAYGELASRLMSADTHGSGMPTSKGLDVTLEKLSL